MVNAVSVVPEDAEIGRGGLHGGETLHGAVAVADSLRVGVERNAPDALDCIVFRDELLDHVHIRSVRKHGNRDHLKTEILADGEVTVVSGSGTEEFDLREVFPRSVALCAENIVADNRIIHHIEAGVAADDDFFHRNSEKVGEEFLGFRDAVEQTVVAGVGSVGGDVAVECVENAVHKVKLGSGGFPAGHIQFQVLVDVVLVLLLQFFATGQQLFLCKCLVIHRIHLFVFPVNVSAEISSALFYYNL